MKQYVIIIEYAGGTDKGCDGFRADTKPILNALKNIAINGEVVFYTDIRKDELLTYIKQKTTSLAVSTQGI